MLNIPFFFFLRGHVNMYVQPPYTEEDELPIHVATWNLRRGLKLTSHLTLFPEKYIR